MNKNIQKIIDKYNNKAIEDYGSVNSPAMKQFASYVKRQFKAAAIEYGFELDSFNVGHYYISGFFRKDNVCVYFSYDVPRGNYPMDLLASGCMNGWLYRTAKSNKDYTGGSNNFSNLYYLMDNIQTLFKRTAPKTPAEDRCQDCAALINVGDRLCCDEYHNPEPIENIEVCPEGLEIPTPTLSTRIFNFMSDYIVGYYEIKDTFEVGETDEDAINKIEHELGTVEGITTIHQFLKGNYNKAENTFEANREYEDICSSLISLLTDFNTTDDKPEKHIT